MNRPHTLAAPNLAEREQPVPSQVDTKPLLDYLIRSIEECGPDDFLTRDQIDEHVKGLDLDLGIVDHGEEERAAFAAQRAALTEADYNSVIEAAERARLEEQAPRPQ